MWGQAADERGRFTSNTLGKKYRTPFSVHCKVKNGLITYMLVSFSPGDGFSVFG